MSLCEHDSAVDSAEQAEQSDWLTSQVRPHQLQLLVDFRQSSTSKIPPHPGHLSMHANPHQSHPRCVVAHASSPTALS